jgi:hypothetical protein
MSLIEFEGLAFSADVQRRTITGLLVPWGRIGRHTDGRTWRFARGSLKFGHAKYLIFNDEHVQSARLGRAIDAVDTDEGLVVTWKIAPGAAGDRALARAASGAKTGLSPEVEIDTADMMPDPENPGARLVTMANLTGGGFVANPAFDDSRVISVMANRNGGPTMNCPTCGAPMTPGVAHTCATPAPAPAPAPTDPAPAPAPAPAPTDPAPADPGQVTFSADQMSVLLRNGVSLGAPRPVVDPTTVRPAAPAPVVTEPMPYRFSREGISPLGIVAYVFSGETEHDLSRDLLTIAKSAAEHTDPGASLDRVNDFIKRTFADVEIADVPGTRVARLRPEMWVPQRDYKTPLWDLAGKGPVDEMPFYVPKFTSASGLVGRATEKTEPAGGSFVDELQTITPGQLWGKVEITRQLWRSQGTPQLSGILWDQMLRSFFEAREAAIATFLNTLTAAADITLTGTPASSPDNDDDQLTVSDFTTAVLDLNFARGGQSLTAMATHQALYRVFGRVKDDAGRSLYPQINPQNADGTSQRRYTTIDVDGVTAVPAYALGTPGTAAVNSWLFDPACVFAWAGAPERLYWDFGATVQTANVPQLSFVTLGLYANDAYANTDITGVRQVIFDPSV